MSVSMVANTEYRIKQGQRVTITNDRTTLTLQVRQLGADDWIQFSSGATTVQTLPFMDGHFRATALTGGNDTVFDISGHT